MYFIKSISSIVFIAILTLILGCSGGNSITTPDNVLESANNAGDFGLMGAYELTINPDDMTAELTTKRISAIGEDYIVSGIGFFTVAPCPDCLQISGISFVGGNIVLGFSIRHPFEPGNTGELPTAINRLDLDVFDLAMIVVPIDRTATVYTLTNTSIYSGALYEPDGYTTEMANVISEASAIPYILVIDETGIASHTWNKFGMGATANFDLAFILSSGSTLRFDLYLTMGYGFSAIKPDRLEPKYYNPEFNRKSAWKVEASATGEWSDTTTPVNVEVKVYDWQAGATVYATPDDFDNAPENNVFAASDFSSVSVEIPGMSASLFTSTTADSGNGMPDNPYILLIPVINQLGLAAGEYAGLVKVTDERACLTPSDGRDFIIDTEDGVELFNYEMPEYATYQTFMATVVEGNVVGNVTIEVNRSTGSGYGEPFDATGPWTLSWDAADNAEEYAIYYDNDPSDGLINLPTLVGTTTGLTFTVPASHLPANHFVIGNTYIVRARETLGVPGSETGDSEQAFIMANGWESIPYTDPNYEIIGVDNTGEGWLAAIQLQFTATGIYKTYYPITYSNYQAHGMFTGRIVSSDTGSTAADRPGDWSGATIETPVVPDSTVRFIDMAFWNRRLMTAADGGIIVGTVSGTRPSESWSAPSNMEWAEASGTAPFTGYNNSDCSENLITNNFGGVPAGNICWAITTADIESRLGCDVNATGNPADPYVAIMGVFQDDPLSTQRFCFDDIAIMIY